MQSRLYFSGLGSALLWRYSAPSKLVNNSIFWRNFHASPSLLQEGENFRAIQSTNLRGKQGTFYRRYSTTQLSSSTKDLRSKRSGRKGAKARRGASQKAKKQTSDGSIISQGKPASRGEDIWSGGTECHQDGNSCNGAKKEEPRPAQPERPATNSSLSPSSANLLIPDNKGNSLQSAEVTTSTAPDLWSPSDSSSKNVKWSPTSVDHSTPSEESGSPRASNLFIASRKYIVPNDYPDDQALERERDCKTTRTSPGIILEHFLDNGMLSDRRLCELFDENYEYSSSLPTILVAHLLECAHQDEGPKNPSKLRFSAIALKTLHANGFTLDDLAAWAWIVSAPSTEEMINRFLCTKSEKPAFLLSEMLRRKINSVRTLKLLLIHTWDKIMDRAYTNITDLSKVELDARIPWSDVSNFVLGSVKNNHRAPKLEITYAVILNHLLRHIRRIWPQAIVSLSHMVAPIMYSNYNIGSFDFEPLDSYTHHKACTFINHMIRMLAEPAEVEPYKSMSYNWTAQKVLLELAGRFEPPLILDQTSYRAILSVLAAQKKTKNESRVSNLRARSWPPWRIDQDGMDAKRSLEDDLSRVVSVITQARESGYLENSWDRSLKILGGQDTDGTPTIHTRKLISVIPTKYYHPLWDERFGQTVPIPHEWAARIEATRDIQEAWSAFLKYEELGGTPNVLMYRVMFEKLRFEKKRVEGRVPYDASPGDGKELFPPSNDNFSEFYQRSLQPPSIKILYKQMVEQHGIRPSGRFLNSLISTARTPTEGLRYIQDSQTDPQVVDFLKTGKGFDPSIQLSAETLAAFIKLLCRFAPRAAVATNESDLRVANVEGDGDSAPTQFSIHEFKTNHRPWLLNPLQHSIELLKESRTDHRQAWNQLFNGLSRRDVVIDRQLVGHPKNDLLSWQVLAASLNDFRGVGLELDPRGFLYFCRGLEKAIVASLEIPEEEREEGFTRGGTQIQILADEFMRMTEIIPSKEVYKIPRLLFAIDGVHIHGYVRVLGLVGDFDEIMRVLQWMVDNHEPLEEISALSRNGPKMTRRVFVAMRVFLHGNQYETKARNLVESVERWDGWPSDYEARLYLQHWSGVQGDGPGEGNSL